MAEPIPTRTREEDVASARVGSTIKGKWRLDGLLGVGGVAAVYAATHRNGQRAALKIMHSELARDRSVVERFLREAYVANRVGHPACVRVLDDDATEADEPFLIMDLLEGETVRDYWRRTGKTIPATEALHIAERVLDCLAACHALGIIHRDLKPANIFLTRAGEIKLLDFGVARESDGRIDDKTAGLALGTPAYMSPEQAKGQLERIDGRSDIFSVGALLHALITGRRIHRGKTEKESLQLAASQPIPSVATIDPTLPADLVRLIDRALGWEPERRFPNAREMQTAVISAMRAAETLGQREAPEDSGEPESEDLTPVHEVVARDDARVRDIETCLAAWELGLTAGIVSGFDAPATQPLLRRAFDATVEVHRRRHAAIHITVRPFGFCSFDHILWEPALPLAAIPHRLFEGGVRALRILPGVEASELKTLLQCLALRDDDDIVSPLWEAALPHVRMDACMVAALGDLTAREEHVGNALRDEAETARRVHAARSAGSAWSDEASPLAPDDVIRAVHASQLMTDRWGERYAELCTDGLLQAGRSRSVGAVLGALRKVASDLYADRRYEDAAEIRGALVERLGQRVGPKDAPKLAGAMTSAMLGRDALDQLFLSLSHHAEDLPRAASLLEDVPASEVATILAATRRPMPAVVHQAMTDLVARLAGPDQAATAAPSTPPPAGTLSADALMTLDARSERHARIVVSTARALLAVLEGQEDEEALAVLTADLHEETTAHGAFEAFYAPGATFVGGRLLFGDRAVHEAAASVATALARCGAHAVRCVGAPDAETVRVFIRTVAGTVDRAAPLPIVGPLSLVMATEAARTQGIAPERLSIEPRVIRVRASAVAALRAHLPTALQVPRTLRHVARAIVEISDAPAWLVAAVTEPPTDSDEASRAASAGILAAAMGRLLVDDRSQLYRLVLAALGSAATSVPLPELAATLASQTSGKRTALARAVITFEATWVARSDRDGPLYHGAKAATLHARIVAMARGYIDRLADRKPPPPTPQMVVATLAQRAVDTTERTVLRMLVATLGFVPAGTVVKLSSGETAEVIASNRGTGRGPLARLVLDESGEEYSEPFEVELAPAGDDGLRIEKVLNIEQWRKGEAPRAPKQASADRRSGVAGPSAVPSPVQSIRVEEPPGDQASGNRPASALASISPSPAPVASVPTAAGDLGKTPLPHLLVYMLDHALTGTLILEESDHTRHEIYLVRGGPVRVRTGRMIAPLGALLVAAGLLSDADAAEAVRQAKSTSVRLGEYLVKKDLLARVDLLRALEVQVTHKVEGLVNLPANTTFAFFRDTDLSGEAPAEPLEVDALGAILAASRAWADRGRIRNASERAAALLLAVHPESTMDLVELTEVERAVWMEMRTQPCTIQDLLARTSAREEVETLLFVALVTRQLLVPGQAKGPMGVRPANLRSARPSPFPNRISSFAPPRSSHVPSPPMSVTPGPASVRMPEPPRSQPVIHDSPPPQKRHTPAPTTERSHVPGMPTSTRNPSIGVPKKVSWSDLVGVRRPSMPAMRASVQPSGPARSATPPPVKPKVERPLTESGIEAMALLRRAEQALIHKDISGSLRIAKRAQDRDGTLPDLNAFVIWVGVLSGETKPPAALARLEEVLSVDASCTTARLYKGKLLKRENRVHEAMAEFQAVLAEQSDNKDAQNELKLILLTMKPGR